MSATEPHQAPSLAEIVREWGRIGCIGFGGPPAHVTLLRELCVTRRGWLSDDQFERALAAVNLLPGPASTQLAIYCAWRLRGNRGALVGGLCFVLPGLVLILALSTLFLAGSPPRWVRGAGMGAGAAVPAVAVAAGLGVARPILARARGRLLGRIVAYALAGGAAAATVGPYLVLVLLACGAVELAWRGVTSGELRHLRLAAACPAAAHALADDRRASGPAARAHPVRIAARARNAAGRRPRRHGRARVDRIQGRRAGVRGRAS